MNPYKAEEKERLHPSEEVTYLDHGYDEEKGMRPCYSPPNIRQRAAMPGGLYFFDFLGKFNF